MNKGPRVPKEERIRRYIARMEPSVSGQNGHNALFNAVRALLHGFGLSQEEARPFLAEFNARCSPPWREGELEHKLRSVDGLPSKAPRGYLFQEEDYKPTKRERESTGMQTEKEVRKKVEFELERLRRIAAPFRDVVDVAWLANRSSVDPATVSAADFLRILYPAGEKILIFQNEFSQGEALWPADAVPTEGRVGVWFLPQPVCGEYLPNPEGRPKRAGEDPPPSRRTWRCVQSFRYFVLESDKAPMRDWLGWIVQVPLRIEALYTSGSRSIHALIRVDARTKEEWDEIKRRLMPFLVASLICGADRGTWSAVRLSRLPGCLRHGKMVPLLDETGQPVNDTQGRPKRIWQQYPEPGEQKLLYLRPGADPRPICDRPTERDVVAEWCDRATSFFDGHTSDAEQLAKGLGYYARVSPRCAENLQTLNEHQDEPTK